MAESIDRYLTRAEILAQIQAHASRLLRLEAQLQGCLPSHLAESCHVANLRDTEISVHADSGAAAAKLNQILPRIVAALQEQGAPVTRIRVRVKPMRTPAMAVSPERRSVSDQTRREIDRFATALPEDSPVAEALRRFVRRSG